MARKRQEIIRQLKEEGVFDLQRELILPTFTKHIAVISAESAAGYGDFCRQLEDNDYGFHFEVTLFPAIMQGEQVEQSIISALNQIYATVPVGSPTGLPSFDCVVILRGGGATADLSGFDTLALAENVAQFPLPVITGIGHERDESILDMVAHTRVKTPTAAAALLIDHLRQVLERINSAQQRITTAIFQRIANQKMRLTNLQTLLPALVQRNLAEARHRIEMLEVLLKSHDPQRLLSRGYSITLLNGRAVRDPQQLKAGDVLETRVEKGTIKSTVL
jgi:exodeoxyribonuclease VII large subunit